MADEGVPAVARLELRRALATAIDLDREPAVGDHFYVRYEQAFTAEGAPIGVARVLWAELRTKAKGTIALYRFRPAGGEERLWLANGEAAEAPPIRLPLDIVSVSSGFGLRPDPLDKPTSGAPAVGPLPDPPSPPAAAKSAPAPEQVAPAAEEQPKPVRRHAMHGALTLGGQSVFAGQMNARVALDASRREVERLVAERALEARRAAEAAPVDDPSPAAEAKEQAKAAAAAATRAPHAVHA